nr:ABC transporter ATP-binding protein [bacterium]
MRTLMRMLRDAKKYRWLLAITGLLLLAITGLNLLMPQFVQAMLRVVEEAPKNGLTTIAWLAVLLAALYGLRFLFAFLRHYLAHVASWSFVHDMRMKVFNHIQYMSMDFFQNEQTGRLMSRIVNDTSVCENILAHALPDLCANILVFVGAAIVLFCINPILALFTLIPVPFIFLVTAQFIRKLHPLYRTIQEVLARFSALLQDGLSGIREIQVFGQQEHESQMIGRVSKEHVTKNIRGQKLGGVLHPLVELCISMGTVIVVGLGGTLAFRGTMDSSEIVGFILYLSLFYAPAASFAVIGEQLQQGLAGAERAYHVLDMKPTVQDAPDARELTSCQGEITFDHVSFGYDTDQVVLDDISFTVKPGQMLALVGPTGVGKSTIAGLIARFYDPRLGSVKIDGVDVKEYTLSSLRQQLSIVLQDVFLFNGTIAENIAYARPNATQQQIEEAARIACIDSYIKSLPEGYNTPIGERGFKLSGGQKQRLSIARAVLRNSPILIFDEATSAIDVETEAEIQQALQTLSGMRTMVVIAHRLSTIRNADQILVLSENGILERGTHDELIAKGGEYARMVGIQTASVH